MRAIFLVVIFLLVAAAVFAALRHTLRRTIDKRVRALAEKSAAPAAPDTAHWINQLTRAARPLARVSLPDDGAQASSIRRRFLQAGLRHPSAPVIFFALKTLLAFGLPMLLMLARTLVSGALPGRQFIMVMGLLCGIGFHAPGIVLDGLIRARQRDILATLPDAIDLITICVEAGLSLDAALARVAREIEIKSPTFAEELQILTLELRAGYGRAQALHNLSLRTGVAEIDALVRVLVQAERFGVSMGDSLRTCSHMLRHNRQSRAEENAARVSVKLLFPLVLCIFPAIMVVVGGPALLRIMKVLPALGGG